MRAAVLLLAHMSSQRGDKLSAGTGTLLPYPYIRLKLPRPLKFLGWIMLIESLYSESHNFTYSRGLAGSF